MTYDFETIVERRGKDAVAVEAPAAGTSGGFFPETEVKEGFSIIPMWVADMNFQTAPAVAEAIRSRAEHHLYGYFRPHWLRKWYSGRGGIRPADPVLRR